MGDVKFEGAEDPLLGVGGLHVTCDAIFETARAIIDKSHMWKFV